MKIELSGLKVVKAASEETTFFRAVVVIDGVKAATAENDGQGGATFLHALTGKRALVEAADEYCKALPPVHAFGMDLPQSLDFVVDMLVEDGLARKDLQRMLATKLVFRKPKGDLYTMKVNAAEMDRMVALVKQKHPGALILNLLSFDEALKLYKDVGHGN